MVVVTLPDKGEKIENNREATAFLENIGIHYERWNTDKISGNESEPDRILETYHEEVDRLMKIGGYTTADVIDMKPDTPGLDSMLQKFRKEHTHSEDEVRYTIEGRGIFYIHPEAADVVSIEVEAGDLIRIPRGTRHWFDLCTEKRIRAIRLFQDPSGWTPYYTGSEKEKSYEPVCFGPSYIPPTRKRGS
jgi:1,2-dihydroxy-3-keto-5-methylthiopentene dioxygenase